MSPSKSRDTSRYSVSVPNLSSISILANAPLKSFTSNSAIVVLVAIPSVFPTDTKEDLRSIEPNDSVPLAAEVPGL